MGNTWAVDLANVGEIYPWAGYTVAMVIACAIAWLLWHIVQIREEQNDYAEDIKLHGSKENIKKALEERI
jgi:hypothetical protein